MLHLVNSQPNANVCGSHECNRIVDKSETTVAAHQRNKHKRVKKTVGHARNKIALSICALFKIEARAVLLSVMDDSARKESYILSENKS